MSYTIFIANHTALIPQPGRAVNTFPSGLVRVDQTYLGLTSQATTHRATLAVGNDMPDGDSSPCIDGLKIFPEVQERRREDGFTEYIVSAYGRNKSTPTIERRVNYFNLQTLYVSTMLQMNLLRKTVTATVVSNSLPSFASLNLPESDFDPATALLFDPASGDFSEANSITKLSTAPWFATGSVVWRFQFDGKSVDEPILFPGLTSNFSTDSNQKGCPLPLVISSRNFGYWTEWIFAYG